MSEESAEKSSERFRVMREQHAPEVVVELQVRRHRSRRIGGGRRTSVSGRSWRRKRRRIERSDDVGRGGVDVGRQNVAEQVVEWPALKKNGNKNKLLKTKT